MEKPLYQYSDYQQRLLTRKSIPFKQDLNQQKQIPRIVIVMLVGPVRGVIHRSSRW